MFSLKMHSLLCTTCRKRNKLLCFRHKQKHRYLLNELAYCVKLNRKEPSLSVNNIGAHVLRKKIGIIFCCRRKCRLNLASISFFLSTVCLSLKRNERTNDNDNDDDDDDDDDDDISSIESIPIFRPKLNLSVQIRKFLVQNRFSFFGFCSVSIFSVLKWIHRVLLSFVQFLLSFFAKGTYNVNVAYCLS